MKNKANIFQEDSLVGIGRLPPQATDVEEAILGAMMLERDSVSECLSVISPDDMYKEKNQYVFKAIVDLVNNGDPVDMKTVLHRLKKNGTDQLCGGALYLAELTSKVNSGTNIVTHSMIVKENSLRRKIIMMASKAIQDSYDNSNDVFDLLDGVNNQFQGMYEGGSDIIHLGSKEKVMQVIENIEKAKESRLNNETIGVPTSFEKLDQFSGGFHPTDLIIIAARPGMGKTAFIATIMKRLGVDMNIPVGMFSMEMSWMQIAIRIVSMTTNINAELFRNGKIEDYQMKQLVSQSSSIIGSPIYVDDTPGLSINELTSKAKIMVQKYGAKILLVDYMQLAEGDKRSKANREQVISEISRRLKGIAKELNVPVIALSQLSRSVETRGGDKRPLLSDLRESGSIEQDADVVMFLYRPEYYGVTEDADGNSTRGIGEVIYAKNRHGKVGSELLRFIGKFTKWAENEEPISAEEYSRSFPKVDMPDVSDIQVQNQNPQSSTGETLF